MALDLMIGSNYDPELPDKLNELNEQYKDSGAQIHEIYGSVQNVKVFGSARPDFRVPNVSKESFEESVKKLNDYGIIVNYTENTPLIVKDKVDVDKVKDNLKYLEDIGVKRLTLAHPLAMQIVGEYSNLPVEISTIYRANTVYQLRELKRRNPNINKVCIDVAKNRDFHLLTDLQQECRDNLEIDVELLANEFCITDCADRIQCYNEHAQVSTDEETAKFKRYPMSICTYLRNIKDPVEWTRARFILPQSMNFYLKSFGINKFKVTGRTHPTKYILWVVEEYLKQDFHGNLLELWADVRNITRIAKGKEDFMLPKYHINADSYGDDFLMDYMTSPALRNNLDSEYHYLREKLKTNFIDG